MLIVYVLSSVTMVTLKEVGHYYQSNPLQYGRSVISGIISRPLPEPASIQLSYRFLPGNLEMKNFVDAPTGIESVSPAFWASMLNTTSRHPGTKYCKFTSLNDPRQLQTMYNKLNKSAIAKEEEEGIVESKKVTEEGHKNLSCRALDHEGIGIYKDPST